MKMTAEQLAAIKQRLSERKFLPNVSVEGLCIAAMEVHQIDWAEIVRKSNLPHVVKCREQIAYVIYTYINRSTYLDMGKLLNRNHATVMHNVRQARGYVSFEPKYKEQIETILEMAKEWEQEKITSTNK
jgi:chromosomal replication initiation ATPase DnaA